MPKAKTATERTKEYRDDLYWWLNRLWSDHLRGCPLLADLADECEDLFHDGPELVDLDRIKLADLERVRDRFNALPERVRKERFNGWRWRTTPPTRQEGRKQRDDEDDASGAALDCVTLDTNTAGGVSGCRVIRTDANTSLRVTFPAGRTRAEVLAALIDLTAHVQQRWPEVLNSEYTAPDAVLEPNGKGA